MNNKIKIILNYLLLFILSLNLFLIIGLFITKYTIMRPNYIINRLNKMNYYAELEKDIKTEMSYYTNQSGFEDDILDDTFTIDELKKETITYIKNIYNGKETKIDSSTFEEKLNNKINAFLENENFKIDNRSEIDKFVTEMAKIYVKRIKVISYLEKLNKILPKLNKYMNKAITLSIISFVVLLTIKLIINKFKHLNTVLYTNSFLIISSIIYVKNKVSISNIFIYNKLFSKVVLSVVNNIINNLIIIAILLIIIALISSIFKPKMEN